MNEPNDQRHMAQLYRELWAADATTSQLEAKLMFWRILAFGLSVTIAALLALWPALNN